MKQLELKVKTAPELQKLLAVTRAQLFAARYRNSTGNLTKSHQVPMLKRQVARIMALLKVHATHARLTSPSPTTNDYQAAVAQISADTKAFRARLANKLRTQQNLEAGLTPPPPAAAEPDAGAAPPVVAARVKSSGSVTSDSDDGKK